MATIPTSFTTHPRQAAYGFDTLKDIDHLSRSLVGPLEWRSGRSLGWYPVEPWGVGKF